MPKSEVSKCPFCGGVVPFGTTYLPPYPYCDRECWAASEAREALDTRPKRVITAVNYKTSASSVVQTTVTTAILGRMDGAAVPTRTKEHHFVGRREFEIGTVWVWGREFEIGTVAVFDLPQLETN